jgi:hypothetical protein
MRRYVYESFLYINPAAATHVRDHPELPCDVAATPTVHIHLQAALKSYLCIIQASSLG